MNEPILFLTFNDVMVLLAWIVSLSFAAYIISHVAKFFPRFMSSVTNAFKSGEKYNRDYNFKFLRFKTIPQVKVGKKNHGRTIFKFNKRR